MQRQGEAVEEMSERGPKVFWDVVCNVVTYWTLLCCVLKAAKRVDLKSSHHKKKL